MKKNCQSSTGFTLIELLVVIAVIGILASVVLASLNTARTRAKDSNIKSELSSIQTALEIYYNEYGTYLVAGSGYFGGGQGWLDFQDGGPYTVAVTSTLTQLGYLSSMPLQDSPNYMIYLCNNNQQYAISATLASATTADVAHLQSLCNGSGVNSSYGKNYGIGN